MKRIIFLMSLVLTAALTAVPAFAEEAASNLTPEKLAYYKVVGLAIVAGMTLAAIGGALSQSNAISAAIRGISKNSEAAGRIMIPLVVGLAFIESLVIYALVANLILLFANPFKI